MRHIPRNVDESIEHHGYLPLFGYREAGEAQFERPRLSGNYGVVAACRFESACCSSPSDALATFHTFLPKKYSSRASYSHERC
jgi:hypothetical protein